jgi:Tfp pilus assembly protein PilV
LLPSRRRRGLSLLEVLISVAIFLGSLTAIMQVLNTGRRSELSSRLQSEAVLRCEAKMSEFVAGVEQAVSSQNAPFLEDDDTDWRWSAEVVESGTPGLLMITVVVEHTTGGDDPNASFSLVRFMRDPQLFVDAALAESGE